MNIAVTDHAVERYLQRVRGALDPRPEIAGRVRLSFEAGRVAEAERGTVHVRDLDRPDLVYVCVWDRPRDELVVVTLWEQGADAAVPREFTDALRSRRDSANAPELRAVVDFVGYRPTNSTTVSSYGSIQPESRQQRGLAAGEPADPASLNARSSPASPRR